MNRLSIFDPASSLMFGHQPLATVIWSGVKDRMVKIIRTGPGLIGVALTVGVLFGISMVSMINFYHAKKKRDLQTRCESIELAEVLILHPLSWVLYLL